MLLAAGVEKISVNGDCARQTDKNRSKLVYEYKKAYNMEFCKKKLTLKKPCRQIYDSQNILSTLSKND
jgi:hypothetical protein